jgi:predicted PurR-regulated permease PerM
LDNVQIKKLIFYSLLAMLTILLLYPYWVTLVWAAIFSIILYPVQIKLQKYTSDRYRVLLVVATFALVILIPIVLLILFELFTLSNYLSNHENINKLMTTTNRMISNLPMIGYYIRVNHVNLESLLKEAFKAENIQNFIPIIKYSGGMLFGFFVNAALLLVILYQFLKYEKNIKFFFISVVFKGFQMKTELLETLVSSTRQISLNILLVGFSTGIIMGIIYYFLDLSFAASIGILTGIIAIIPLMPPIFYGMLALILIFNQLYFSAMVIFLMGLLIHFLADNVIQPKLLQSQANLNFAASLLGILAGLEMLGPVGIFLGPIVFNAALNSMKRIYKQQTI